MKHRFRTFHESLPVSRTGGIPLEEGESHQIPACTGRLHGWDHDHEIVPGIPKLRENSIFQIGQSADDERAHEETILLDRSSPHHQPE